MFTMSRSSLPMYTVVGWLMVSVALCWSGDASAADEVAVLPEIVVTPTRSDEDAADVPGTTEVIRGEDIQGRKLSRSTPEALKELPAVMVQRTSHGQGSPFIRGFTGFRTLFLIDGIRLNNSVFRDGPNQYWNSVDSFSYDRLELVKGPASVLYGSDAIGGAVNALTLSPFDRVTDPDRPWGGRTSYRYSTAEDSHTVRAEGYTVQEGKLGASAGVTYRDYGDLRAGGDTGEQPHTGYTEADVDAKLEYRVTEDTRLTLAHQTVSQNDVWRTHKTIYAKSFEGTKVGDEKKRTLDQDRSLTYIQLDAKELQGLVEDLNLTVSYQRQEEEQYRVKKDSTSDREGFEVDTLGASLQLTSPSAIGEWVYGLEYYRDFVTSSKTSYKADGSFKSESIQGPVADDSTYDSLGAYLQDSVPIGPRAEVVLGGRYNYNVADVGAYQDPISGDEKSFSDDWDAFVGSLRALVHLDEEKRASVFAGISQGFRAPNLSDLTRFDTARSSEIETPSTDLAPERYLAYELGLKINTEPARLQLAGFYTGISDMIVRTPTRRIIDENREVTKKNAGDGHVLGVEAGASVTFFEDWCLWGNATWMDGEMDAYPTSEAEEVREPMDRLMPLTVNIGLRFKPSDRWWAETVVTVADRQDNLSSREKEDTQRIPPGGTPGYTILSFRGGYDVTRHLTLAAVLENVTDEDYRVHGSGLNEAGRNLVVSAEYRF